MQEFKADITINRPISQVFQWLTTPENHRKYDRSSIEMECLTPGPWRKGSQFREVRGMGPRQMEVFSELIEFEQDQKFVVQSKTGPGWLGTWLFIDLDGKTNLKWTAQFRLRGIGRLFEGFLGSKIRRQVDQQFKALPAIIEQEI